MKTLFLICLVLFSNASHAAFQKEKTLSSGVTGNYWAVSELHFNRKTMMVDLMVNLYKDNTPGLAPLGYGHKFSFKITQQEITGNVIQWAHSKILAYANSDLPNLDGNGTHKGFPDLIGATVVP